MRTIKQMVDWLLGELRQSSIPPSATFRAGVVAVGSHLELCDVGDRRRGVKVVTVTVGQAGRIFNVQNQFRAVQGELEALPKSLRPRKRKIKIVSLPPSPSTASGRIGRFLCGAASKAFAIGNRKAIHVSPSSLLRTVAAFLLAEPNGSWT